MIPIVATANWTPKFQERRAKIEAHRRASIIKISKIIREDIEFTKKMVKEMFPVEVYIDRQVVDKAIEKSPIKIRPIQVDENEEDL